jgi:hypothetical protein
MDTLGALVDKLSIVNQKMFNAQEVLYETRRMSFDEFKSKYGTEEGLKTIFDIFKKSCELNYQRSQLIDEIDELVIKIATDASTGLDLQKFMQKKFKTY